MVMFDFNDFEIFILHGIFDLMISVYLIKKKL